MAQINAFVGHSFASEDREVVQAFLKFLDQVKALNMGFTWESAEPAEPKELADKVKRLIQDKNVFIGICTTKEGVVDPGHLRKSLFNGRVLKVNEEHLFWKTSDWIIQEIGLAIGRGMELVLLVERGLRQPGGLQGNLEYIPFERRTPEKSFGKLLEMIQALQPKAKALPVLQAETGAVSEEKPQIEPTEDSAALEPKEGWTRADYELALFRAIVRGNTEREQAITAAYFATDDGQIALNRENWEARQEHVRIVFGAGGTLTKLQEVAVKYPDNGGVQRYLGLGYEHYEEHEKAGQCFLLAAKKAVDKRTELARLGQALVAFGHAGRKEESQKVVEKMKTLVPQIQDGESILINALRDVKEIQNNKDLLFGIVERLLQLHPDDVKSRFDLAYNYSLADQNQIALYHYLKIPYQERTPVTWNNLGVQSDQCDLASKSVNAYRVAENLGDTLAMSNLARKFIKAGFLTEAQEICNRSLQVENYHKNVGYAIQRIKTIPEEEDNKQKEVLEKAAPLSEFYRDYGWAAVQNQILEHNGRWRGPDCELQIEIKDGVFLAEGEYEVSRSTLSLALLGMPGIPAAPETDKYHIKYSGQTYGYTVKCGVIREEIGKSPIFHSLLGQMMKETSVLMVVADTMSEIRVYEKDSPKEPRFYTLTRIG